MSLQHPTVNVQKPMSDQNDFAVPPGSFFRAGHTVIVGQGLDMPVRLAAGAGATRAEHDAAVPAGSHPQIMALLEGHGRSCAAAVHVKIHLLYQRPHPPV